MHSEPKIAGSIDLRLPRQQLSETPGGKPPERLPSFWQNEIPLLIGGKSMPCTWASCVGRLSSHYSSPPGARAATRRPAARPPMSRRRSVIPRTGKNSLSRPTEIPCFRMEQGIGCKLLNSLCDRAQKTAPRGQNRMKFPKFPCYFPCSQGMRGSGRIKSRHALPSRRLTDVRSLDIGRGEFIMNPVTHQRA